MKRLKIQRTGASRGFAVGVVEGLGWPVLPGRVVEHSPGLWQAFCVPVRNGRLAFYADNQVWLGNHRSFRAAVRSVAAYLGR